MLDCAPPGILNYQRHWWPGLEHVQQDCHKVSALTILRVWLLKYLYFRAITYYFVTTISAVILGICLVTTLRPGQGAKIVETQTESIDKASKVLTPDTLMDLVR